MIDIKEQFHWIFTTKKLTRCSRLWGIRKEIIHQPAGQIASSGLLIPPNKILATPLFLSHRGSKCEYAVKKNIRKVERSFEYYCNNSDTCKGSSQFFHSENRTDLNNSTAALALLALQADIRTFCKFSSGLL